MARRKSGRGNAAGSPRKIIAACIAELQRMRTAMKREEAQVETRLAAWQEQAEEMQTQLRTLGREIPTTARGGGKTPTRRTAADIRAAA